MRFRSIRRPASHELSLTSMIDVTFLLLVFFLCTLRFRSLEGKLASELPRNGGSAPTESLTEKIEVGIDVIAAGTRVSRSSGEPISESRSGAANASEPYDFVGRSIRWSVAGRAVADEQALVARLRAIHGADAELAVRVRAGIGVVYGEVVRTLDAIAEAGISDVGFTGASR